MCVCVCVCVCVWLSLSVSVCVKDECALTALLGDQYVGKRSAILRGVLKATDWRCFTDPAKCRWQSHCVSKTHEITFNELHYSVSGLVLTWHTCFWTKAKSQAESKKKKKKKKKKSNNKSSWKRDVDQWLMSARGAMRSRIDPTCRTHWAISRSSQCSTNGITKAMTCAILYRRSMTGNR